MQDRFKGKSTNKSWTLGHRGRLWQPRSYDHVLREEESVMAVADYILNNPVRKGYVKQWQDWPYSVRLDLLL
ncbi:MAG: hypothetical protein HY000_22895 [Planctomycetes bacterium]|nr:hypothetical protein [Planctomycetota bacterium]